MTEQDNNAGINYLAMALVIGLLGAGYFLGSEPLTLAAFLFVPFAVMP